MHHSVYFCDAILILPFERLAFFTEIEVIHLFEKKQKQRD